MKTDSLEARRAAEVIELTDLERRLEDDVLDSLGGNIESDYSLSKGSLCCKAAVHYDKAGICWCSCCGLPTEEMVEDEDEYLERMQSLQEEQEERDNSLAEAFEHLNNGGY